MTNRAREKTVNRSEAALEQLLHLEIRRLLEREHWERDSFYDANPKAISDPTEILVRAARDGDLETVDAALAAGADINGRSCRDMHTALTASLTSTWRGLYYKDRLGFACELLERGADVNVASPDGRTPLIEACGQWIHLGFVEWLLILGADPNLTDNKGRTAIMAAIQPTVRNGEVLKLLAKFGADVDATGDGGNTALHMVVSRCTRFSFSAKDRTDLDIASLLIECGASPNIRNNNGETPLMLAAKNGSTHMAKLLLENEANPCIMNNEGKLPVEVAMYKATRRVIAKRMRQLLHRIEDRCQLIGPRQLMLTRDNIWRIIRAANARRIKWMKEREDYFPEDDYDPNDYDPMEFANMAIDEFGRTMVVSSEEILSMEEP